MFNVIKTLFISWILLWSHIVLSNDLIEEQLGGLPQEEIDKLKEIQVTDGINSFIEENKLVALSEEDKEVLRLMGFSEDELNSMGAENFLLKENTTKLRDGFIDYSTNKEKEVREGIFKDSIPGLASSVIGLGFASFMGIVIGVKCRTQPSALAFAGSSAAWVGLELMNWNNYKLEMNKLKKLGAAPQEFAKLEKILAKIQNDVKALKPHADKLKDEDTLEEGISGVGTQLTALRKNIEDLKALMQRLDSNQIEALRSLTKSLEAATEVTKKKARNAKIAAVGFTAASAVAVMESFNAFGGGGNCFSTARNNKYKLFRNSLELLFPESFAFSVSIGDLDKIGIPLGAGGAAAYLAFEGQFLDKIYANGWSRSLIFGIMAGNAYYASAKLKKATEFLDAQAKEVRIFTDFFDKRLKQGINLIDTPIDLIEYAENQIIPKALLLVEKYNEGKDALESADEVISSVGNLIDENKDKIQEISPDQLKEIVENETGESVEDIQSQIDDVKNTDLSEFGIDEFVSHYSRPSSPSLIDFFIPQAFAMSSPENKVRPSCFVLRPEFLKLDKSCQCIQKKSCTQANFVELKPVKEVRGGAQTIAFANEIMKANQLILTGSPKRGLARYQKLQKFAPIIEKNTQSLLANKNKPSLLAGVKKFHQTISPALNGYFAHTGLPSYNSNKAKPRLAKTTNPNNQKLLDKLRNKVALIHHLQGKESKPRLKNVSFKKSDFISPLQGEAIQKDSSLDIFQIIRQRYLKIINDGRL
jgi:hypothetical protein